MHVFLDTESIDDAYEQNKDKIDRLLLYNNKKIFTLKRSSFEPKTGIIAKIDESKSGSQDIEILSASKITSALLKEPLSDGEREFLYLIIKHASTNEKFKSIYVNNALFISENHRFWRRSYLWTGILYALRPFFQHQDW